MTGIVLIAHEPLASAYRAVALHVDEASARRLVALDVRSDAPCEDIEAGMRQAIAQARDPEALVLVDAFGATPCNRLRQVALDGQLRIVAGLNLPMLLRVMCRFELPVDKLAQMALEGGMRGLISVAASPPQNQGPRGQDNDPDHRHDQ